MDVAGRVSPVMEGVSWGTYQSLRRELDAAHCHRNLTYDRGRLVVTSSTAMREQWKVLTNRMIGVLAEEWNLPLSGYGATTWQREDPGLGIEADECYYIQHARLILGKRDIELPTDPPPDLAFENEVEHHPLDRLAVFRALGFPEIWRYDGQRMQVLVLTSDGYCESAESAAFPRFHPADLHRFLSMHDREFDGQIGAAFRVYLRQPASK